MLSSITNAVVVIEFSSTHKVNKFCIFTASKRSLGQGNVFTRMWHSVHRQEGVSIGGPLSGGVYVQGSLSGGGRLCPGGLCPWAGSPCQGGSLFRGSLSRGSLSGGSLSGGLCLRGLCPGRGISVHGGLCQGDFPIRQKCIPSYWNAFLLFSLNLEIDTSKTVLAAALLLLSKVP